MRIVLKSCVSLQLQRPISSYVSVPSFIFLLSLSAFVLSLCIFFFLPLLHSLLSLFCFIQLHAQAPHTQRILMGISASIDLSYQPSNRRAGNNEFFFFPSLRITPPFCFLLQSLFHVSPFIHASFQMNIHPVYSLPCFKGELT